MAENKSLVEEALLQMKNLEQVVAENAKGILASTMKQEISELVKESLKKETDMQEQDEDEMEIDSDEIEMGSDDESGLEDMDFGDEDDNMSDDESEDELEIDFDMDMDDEDSPIDLRNASDDKILKVFKSMGDDDGIIVTQDDDNIHLEDEDADVEYIIQTEGDMPEEDMDMYEQEYDVEDEIDVDGDEELSDDELNSMMSDIFGEEMSEMDHMGEMDDMSEMDYSEEDLDEVVYEIEFNEEDEDDDVNESMMIKPIGLGIGKVDTKFVGGSNVNMKGFKEDKKYGGTGIGMGKGPGKAFKGKVSGNKVEAKEGKDWGGNKDEYKRKDGHKTGDVKGHYKDYEGKFGGNKGDKSKTHPGKKDYSEGETTEASRTYSNGSKDNTRGLRKAISNNRNYSYGKGAANVNEEVQKLREKNEEYRKALNVFREKLNEVAVFNSNLAYATRLFTEHTTTKQEKINILRRFDDVETLKESKNLYTSIKSELGSNKSQAVVTESFERIEKSPASGSAQNLIESKTYENPQFLRMKDIMSKIAK